MTNLRTLRDQVQDLRERLSPPLAAGFAVVIGDEPGPRGNVIRVALVKPEPCDEEPPAVSYPAPVQPQVDPGPTRGQPRPPIAKDYPPAPPRKLPPMGSGIFAENGP